MARGATLAMLASAAILAPFAPAGAQQTETGRYAALDALPDWTGTWQPDWSTLFGPGGRDADAPKLTPQAQKLQDAYRAAQADGRNVQTEAANCVPPGMPGIMRMPYPIEFVFSPGRVNILHETYSQVRRIYTDGRKLPSIEEAELSFNGTSIGSWEGDTLVVETIGFKPTISFMPGLHPSEAARIVERIHLTAPGVITIETSITDPSLFTAPFQLKQAYVRKRGWDIMEYVCSENNRDGADAEGRATINISQ